jgi:hypothetical protein
VIEMALILPVLLLVIFGALTTGLLLDRLLTVLQVVRYAGSMYARGTDFNVAANKVLLLKGAGGLGIAPTGGTGVIYLSTVVRSIDGSGNPGPLVVAERFVIGNSGFAASRIGSLPGSLNGPVPDYQTDLSARAPTLQAGFGGIGVNERVFVVEACDSMADLGGWTSSLTMNQFYARAFF